MTAVVTRVSDMLSIHPPANGGIDPKKLAATAPSPSSSPFTYRRSFVDQIGLDLFRTNRTKDDPSPPPLPSAR